VQAERQAFGLGRTAAHGKRFREAGQFRPVDLDRPGDEGPPYRLGPAEDGKYEEADGEGAAGSALGDERQGEKRRRDAPQRPPVLQNTRHLRASFARTYGTVGFGQEDIIAAGSGKNRRNH